MLTILLFAVTQTSQSTDFDHFMALGRRRADFGDKPYPVEWSHEQWNIWRHGRMFDDSKPDMLFPAGAYDRRFYLQPTLVDRDPPGGQLEIEYWLAYETKTGTNVGSFITFRWKLLLAEGVPDEMSLDLGTLEMLLYRKGLHVVGPVPDEAKPSLKARKGFAAYYIDPFGESFRYWYVRPDGTETSWEFYDWPWPEYRWDRGRIPATAFPYPITSEERSALTKQGWKYRHPWQDGSRQFAGTYPILHGDLMTTGRPPGDN